MNLTLWTFSESHHLHELVMITSKVYSNCFLLSHSQKEVLSVMTWLLFSSYSRDYFLFFPYAITTSLFEIHFHQILPKTDNRWNISFFCIYLLYKVSIQYHIWTTLFTIKNDQNNCWESKSNFNMKLYVVLLIE